MKARKIYESEIIKGPNVDKVMDKITSNLDISKTLVSMMKEHIERKRKGDKNLESLQRKLVKRIDEEYIDIRKTLDVEAFLRILGKDFGYAILDELIVNGIWEEYWTYKPDSVDELKVAGFPQMWSLLLDDFLQYSLEKGYYIRQLKKLTEKEAHDLQKVRVPKDVYVGFFQVPVNKDDHDPMYVYSNFSGSILYALLVGRG